MATNTNVEPVHEYQWNPMEIIESAVVAGQIPRNSFGCELKYGIVLLNQQVVNEEMFLSFWNEASFRMLADGGEKHWRILSRKFPDLVQFPHVVCDNFDSVRPETLQMLRRHSTVEIIENEKSDVPSDFTQALIILSRKLKDLKIPRVIVFCETSGRFAQVIANAGSLYKFDGGKHIQLFMVSSSSITFLLPTGDHRIFCGKRGQTFLKIRHCALLPIGTPSIVTTKGLRHDLSGETLQFGKKVVTNEEIAGISSKESNKGKEKESFIVLVSSSAPILWDMEYEFDDQLKNVW